MWHLHHHVLLLEELATSSLKQHKLSHSTEANTNIYVLKDAYRKYMHL
jgi:hypothetical protein